MINQSTQAEEEQKSGIAVILFSVIAALIAVVVCVSVSLLTMRGKEPLPPEETQNSQDGTVSGSEENPSNPNASLPVFSPSVTVLPQKGANYLELSGELYSKNAVIVNADTGEILAGKDADQRIYPASMTKIMTLIVACQHLKQGDLDKPASLTSEINDYVRPRKGGYRGASCHWVDVGDGAAVLDQLYGIGVESAADCSVIIACYITKRPPAETEQMFVQWMNEEAAAMGLKNTHFDNLIGYESPNNYSTPADMAAIMMRAMESPLISDILSTPTRTFTAFGYNKAGKLVNYSSYFYSSLFNANPENRNRMWAYKKKFGEDFSLKNGSFGGGKTGSLENSGSWEYSLASFAAGQNGTRFVVVTSGTAENYGVMADAKLLYEKYFQ